MQTHDQDLQKYLNIRKKIKQLNSRVCKLQAVADQLSIKLFTCPVETIYKPYVVRCINWLKKNTHMIDYNFQTWKSNRIVVMCHEQFYQDLLKGFVFTLDTQCSINGCMTWVYGQPTCACGARQYKYGDIDYNYNKDVSLDNKYPLYRVVQV